MRPGFKYIGPLSYKNYKRLDGETNDVEYKAKRSRLTIAIDEQFFINCNFYDPVEDALCFVNEGLDLDYFSLDLEDMEVFNISEFRRGLTARRETRKRKITRKNGW